MANFEFWTFKVPRGPSGLEVLVSRCPERDYDKSRSLGVFVKAGVHPGLFYPDPAQIYFVALALPGGQTSWLARAFALSKREFCCVNSAAATEKTFGG